MKKKVHQLRRGLRWGVVGCGNPLLVRSLRDRGRRPAESCCNTVATACSDLPARGSPRAGLDEVDRDYRGSSALDKLANVVPSRAPEVKGVACVDVFYGIIPLLGLTSPFPVRSLRDLSDIQSCSHKVHFRATRVMQRSDTRTPARKLVLPVQP